MKLFPLNRRHFVKSATAGATLAALPGILKAQQAPSQNVAGANSRINVACVGFSDRFKDALLPSFLKCKDELNFDMVALADLWSKRREEGKAKLEEKLGHGIDLYASDEDLYEKAKNVDAVIISTADFQHARHTVHAVKAGKDTYTEKPLAEDMDAANAVLDAVNEARKANYRGGAVVQVGSQRRSGSAYHIANDYIRSGKFGDITYVDLCWNVNQPRRWRRAESLVASLKPEDTDWKRWLLDRPAVAFDPRKYLEFRTFWPYSSGIPGQWMCHQIDTVAWFTGFDFPRSAVAAGGLYAWKDGRQNPDTFTTLLEYGPEDDPSKGFQAVFSSRQTNAARGNVEKYHSAIGTIDLIKGTVSNEGVENAKTETQKLGETEVAATAANTGAGNMEVAHMHNWLSSVRARKAPNAPIEAGYSHAVALIMSNAAMRTGSRAAFDKALRQVVAGGQVFKGY
ncbi:MAG: Gfo/Idh/MocA family oxidoreductase [Verrucomicrobiota bacterium]|jgi:predicted dehydrogenase|nr:Gfo/Idh/MocA family oxidoreductase [Verrucomicrobiota bacterium]